MEKERMNSICIHGMCDMPVAGHRYGDASSKDEDGNFTLACFYASAVLRSRTSDLDLTPFRFLMYLSNISKKSQSLPHPLMSATSTYYCIILSLFHFVIWLSYQPSMRSHWASGQWSKMWNSGVLSAKIKPTNANIWEEIAQSGFQEDNRAQMISLLISDSMEPESSFGCISNTSSPS